MIIVRVDADSSAGRTRLPLWLVPSAPDFPSAVEHVEVNMLTLCWAAKGGSGTTVFVASAGLADPNPVLLVDLSGDLPLVLGIPQPAGPGVHDWVQSDAPTTRLELLEVGVRKQVSVLGAGTVRASPDVERWAEFATACAASARHVIIDAGTGTPPPALFAVCDRQWLVTRACYVALTRANAQALRPNGVVLVHEPGHGLGRADVEAALGAPIVTRIDLDPAVARAVDAGLLLTRLPHPMMRRIRSAA